MNLTKLRQILTTYFDESELRNLCFDLGVDYDGLPGEAKTDKARELIAYLERRKRLPDLMKVGKQERPDIPWPEATRLAQGETALALLQSEIQPMSSDELWKKFTSGYQQGAIKDQGCAWIVPWPGLQVQSIELMYDRDHSRCKRYDQIMPDVAREALERWRLENPQEFTRLEQEPWGVQVRLERVQEPHDFRGYQVRIHLSPTKYLYYVAIQAQLWRSENRTLRDQAYRNALMGILNRETLQLPMQFAIHMAVVSSGEALLRQRGSLTELYPSAWEAGVGEFMHGPYHVTSFRHFDGEGNPSLSLYLRNAVAEELNYFEARPDDFRLYGFAVEYRTLAPKLLVVYTSDAPINVLLEGAKSAKDFSANVHAIRLTPRGVAKAFTDHRYQDWGPTSKLALMLALTQGASPEIELSICKEVEKQIALLGG